MRGRATTGAAVVLAMAVAGCGNSQTASAPGPNPSAPRTATGNPQARAARTCRSAQLALSYAGTEGATGHLELTMALRNVSHAACRVSGYPRARLLDGAGRILPLRSRRGHGFFPDTLAAPRSVSLTPGAAAHFGISFVTNDEYANAHVCHRAAMAMSAAPGPGSRWQRISLRTAPRISPCGNRVVLSPVHA